MFCRDLEESMENTVMGKTFLCCTVVREETGALGRLG
jgi:hypothetical protein